MRSRTWLGWTAYRWKRKKFLMKSCPWQGILYHSGAQGGRAGAQEAQGGRAGAREDRQEGQVGVREAREGRREGQGTMAFRTS